MPRRDSGGKHEPFGEIQNAVREEIDPFARPGYESARTIGDLMGGDPRGWQSPVPPELTRGWSDLTTAAPEPAPPSDDDVAERRAGRPPNPRRRRPRRPGR